MRIAALAAVVCLVSVFAGCVEDVMLEPDPPTADADGGADATVYRGEPAIGVEPAALVFTAAGERRVLRVENRGTAPLALGGLIREGDAGFTVTLRGDDAFVMSPPLVSIAPGAAAEFVVEALTPELQAVLTITSNDPAHAAFAVPVRVDAPPCLVAAPLILDFGVVDPEAPVDRAIALQNCGDDPLTLDTVAIDGAPAFALVDLLRGVQIAAGAERTIRVRYRPRADMPAAGTLRVEATGVALRVSLAGQGGPLVCPSLRRGLHRGVRREAIHLDGLGALLGSPKTGAHFEWVVVARPDGSTSQPVEQFYDASQPYNGGVADDPSTPDAVFMPDIFGTYRFELRYRDDTGCEGTVEDRVWMAGPITVALEWQVPGAELGLHLLHPNAEGWFSAVYDCWALNPFPDWAQIDNTEDDPVLDRDPVGAGSERITLGVPEHTDTLGAPYRIGVQYARPADGDPGSALATVRVFIGDELVFTADRELHPGSLWEVADVEWPAVAVDAIDRVLLVPD